MAALPDALLYALDGHIGGRQPEEEHAKFIAGCRQRFNPWSECAAGERRLERHIGPLRGEMAQALPALILPASKATLSGRKEERPLAMMSAFTNSCTAKAPARTSAAAVVLPAPFGAGDDYEVGTWGGHFVGRLSIVTRGYFESVTEPRPSGSGQHRRTAHNAKMSHICIAGLSSFSRPPYPWPRRPTFAPSKRSSPKRITT